jgi:putative ABC transport system permease protein
VKFLPLLWAGLWRKRTRTVFTLLSIVVAFVLFGMLQGVNAVFNNAVNAAAVDRLDVVSRVTFTEPLPYGYLSQIESIPGVAGVAYQSWFGTYYQDPKNFVFSCRRMSSHPWCIRAPAPSSAVTLPRNMAGRSVIGCRCTR